MRRATAAAPGHASRAPSPPHTPDMPRERTTSRRSTRSPRRSPNIACRFAMLPRHTSPARPISRSPNPTTTSASTSSASPTSSASRSMLPSRPPGLRSRPRADRGQAPGDRDRERVRDARRRDICGERTASHDLTLDRPRRATGYVRVDGRDYWPAPHRWRFGATVRRVGSIIPGRFVTRANERRSPMTRVVECFKRTATRRQLAARGGRVQRRQRGVRSAPASARADRALGMSTRSQKETLRHAETVVPREGRRTGSFTACGSRVSRVRHRRVSVRRARGLGRRLAGGGWHRDAAGIRVRRDPRARARANRRERRARPGDCSPARARRAKGLGGGGSPTSSSTCAMSASSTSPACE
jgi:hypothetical protein